MHTLLPALLFFLGCLASIGHAQPAAQAPDVLHYEVTIEPAIEAKYLSGSVTIDFQVDPTAQAIVLNAGSLQIDTVSGPNVQGFTSANGLLTIPLSERTAWKNEVTIHYHGNPTKGLLFNPELNQAYTVYFTSHWMVCNNKPSDKATLDLNILVPKELKCIGSGELVGIEVIGEKSLHRWKQRYETPTYNYGFALGNFNEAGSKQGAVQLNYYSQSQSAEDLQKVFRETGNILQFFEKKSGIPYIQRSYAQVLIGDHYQEMSGMAVFKDSYAAAVLQDSSEIHLTSHELAHQWWGNRITCKNFQHFWLNEAFATYMSAAFSEYKFGKKKYDSDIAIYQSIYEGIVKRGKDKPLVFPDWDNPTRDDRNIVYYKGAYVLHLLRQEVGDEAFWNGIKSYSQQYVGKSVETRNFQQAMEKATNGNLDVFFNEWVYKTK